MSKKISISHACIYVSSIKKAREFYDKIMKFLGFKIIDESKSHIGYGNDRAGIWLWQAKNKLRDKVRSRPSYDHIALRTDSRHDIDELQKLLKKNGFKILYPAEEHPELAPGYYSVSFFDPDGTTIELLYLPGPGN